MLSRTFTRLPVARSIRTISTTAVRKNLVQDLYLKEVKNFKPTPKTAADAQANTKAWNPPKAPAPPTVEGAEADSLAQYEKQEVEVEAEAQKEGEEAPTSSMEEWFVVEDTFAEDQNSHH